MLRLQVKLLDPDAKIPAFAHAGDAGMDIYSCESMILAPGARAQVHTGIACAIPEGYVGLLWDKSGLSQKNGLKTLGGVIDTGYRGEILVGLVNLGEEAHTISKGDKIAQMLLQEVSTPEIEVVEALGTTERGENGFGSTGK